MRLAKDFTIERMQPNELDIAIEWAANEGWNPGLHDANCFYPTDPQGFFIGKLAGQPVVVGSAVCYDEQFAFCGFLIVNANYRGQGFGLAITQARLDYVADRITGLDGVLDMCDKYENLGYQFAHHNARYQLNHPPKHRPHANIRPLQDVGFNEVLAFDRQYFPAKREVFLQHWITQPESIALGYIDQQLHGYAVARKCRRGYKVGPLFAKSAVVAKELFLAVMNQCDSGPILLDIPLTNEAAVDLVQSFAMEKVFATNRMYRNGMPKVDLSGVYGITSFELG